MHNHIIAGYDGSTAASAACSWAADEASRRDAGLTVLASYMEPAVSDFGLSSAFLSAVTSIKLRDATQTHVEELVMDLAQTHPGLAVNAVAVHGRPAHELIVQAAHADLLVIGSTGSSSLASSFMGSVATGTFMGSVARAVVRNSPCPVVIVPGEQRRSECPRVVIGVDGTDRSAAAVAWGVDECDLLHGELEVVHAYSYPYASEAEASSEARDLMRIDAALVLEQVLDQARERGGSKVDGHLIEGRPADVILDRALTADLVVIGTRCFDPHSVNVAVLGSVAESVAGRPPCPVAIVREGLNAVRS